MKTGRRHPQPAPRWEVAGPLVLHKTRQREELVHALPAAAQWVRESAAGTIAADADTTSGRGSVKITAAGAVAQYSLSSPFSMLRKSLELALRVDDAAKISTLAVYVFNGATSQYVSGVFTQNGASGYGRDLTKWQYVCLHPLDFSGAAIDLSGVTKIRIDITPVAGQTVNVWVDYDIHTLENWPVAKIAITMDDSLAAVHDTYFPLLQKRGLPATFFPSGWYIDQAGYLTTAHVQEMLRAGCEFGSHNWLHNNLVDYADPSRVGKEIAKNKAFLWRLGSRKGSRFMVTPFAAWDDSVLQQIKKYHPVVSGVFGAMAPSRRTPVWYVKVGDEADPNTVIAWLDALQTHGGVLDLKFHPTYDSSKFETILDAIIARGIECVTLSHLLDSLGIAPQGAEPDAEYRRVSIVLPVNELYVPTHGWVTAGLQANSGYCYPALSANNPRTDIVVGTGVTANSRGIGYLTISGTFGDTRGDINYPAGDLLWEFELLRYNAHAEAVGRIQLKPVTTEGILAGFGAGLEILDMDVYGEAHGSARTVTPAKIATFTNNKRALFWIVFRVGKGWDFYVNRQLVATISTATALPTGTAAAQIVMSIINGATGLTDAIMHMYRPYMRQE